MGTGRIIRGAIKFLGREEGLKIMNRLLNLDGGPGSGNFGHAGRPGEVGGSGSGGGKGYRTQTSEGKYVGVQKAAAFRGIKKVAQKSKDAQEFIHSLSMEQRDMVAQQFRQSGSKERIMDYTERMRQLMCSQKPEKTVPFKIVEGKVLPVTDKWNGEAYTEPLYGQVIDTEIEHVIVKQGFNGPPKVVSQAEFMEHIAAHPEMPVLFRSYSGIDKEQIQAYDDMLENGEWYIDCSNGGAQYGQGLYCAGCYNHNGGKDFSGVKSEMDHYRHISSKNVQARWVPKLEEGEDCFAHDGKQIVYRQDEMKRTQDEKPPVAQDVVAMVKGQWKTETVKGYFMPFDPEDDDSPMEFTYYTDSDGYQTVPAEKVPYYGPYKREEAPPQPSASTRMMTLDPSAKIITFSGVRDLRKKASSDAAIAELGETAKLRGETDKFDLAVQYYEKSMKYEDASDIISGLTAQEQSYVTNMAQAIFETAKKKQSDQPRDPGAFAASMGYDAINAEGHGDTGSYTVVLNRTKLILNQSRVDV